jgi:hypothetical protein
MTSGALQLFADSDALLRGGDMIEINALGDLGDSG